MISCNPFRTLVTRNLAPPRPQPQTSINPTKHAHHDSSNPSSSVSIPDGVPYKRWCRLGLLAHVSAPPIRDTICPSCPICTYVQYVCNWTVVHGTINNASCSPGKGIVKYRTMDGQVSACRAEQSYCVRSTVVRTSYAVRGPNQVGPGASRYQPSGNQWGVQGQKVLSAEPRRGSGAWVVGREAGVGRGQGRGQDQDARGRVVGIGCVARHG